MNTISNNNCVFNIHPIYQNYGSDENGNIINISNPKKFLGYKTQYGYMQFSIHETNCKRKLYYVHRFVFECFNGKIPDNKLVSHINQKKDDNRLCNLDLITKNDKYEKSKANRSNISAKENMENKYGVKAININTGEIQYFSSICSAHKNTGINASLISIICKNNNNNLTKSKLNKV